MRSLVLLCFCLLFCWSYALPGGPQGVGVYAYQDSTGNRYGGTYELKDGQFHKSNIEGDVAFPTFTPNFAQDPDDFFPEFFRNFENILQEAFVNQLQHQKVALNAARKAFDLTSNQAGFIPNFAPRFPSFGGFPDFGGFSGPANGMPGFGMGSPYGFSGGPNSAYAGAAAGPGFSQHRIAINPQNPMQPNIDVSNFRESIPRNKDGFYSVSSSSYSSSSNLNGQKKNFRGGETVVNNNGQVTSYKLSN